jgi:phage-related protein
VTAAMAVVADLGLRQARHLRGEIYEVRATSNGRAFRVLFALEGSRGQILLAVKAFEKKSQRTPARSILLAEARLVDWSIGGLGPDHDR